MTHHLPSTFAAVVLGVTASALALEPAELVDAKLDRQQVQLVNLAGGELSFFDDQRRLRRVSAADFVSLRMVDRTAESPGPAESQAEIFNSASGGVLALSDGHVLHGSFGGAKDGKILWVTQAFGVIPVELDAVVRMILIEGASTPGTAGGATGGGDIVTLTNGDAVRGFIESIDEAGLKIKADNAPGAALELPWDRLAKLTLANPVNRKAGVWVRLVDGTQFRMDDAAFDPAKLTGKAMDRDVNLPGSSVQSIDFALKHQLVPLGDLEPRLVSGGEVFGVAMRPHATGDQLSLHAPVTVEFTLPAAAQRFAAEAIVRDVDLDWADMTLIVTDGKTELARQRLNAEQPRAALNVALKGPTLVLQLDEGVNGPIRDRLHLDRAVILVQLK